MTTIEYRCADGSPFPVTFERPEDVTIQWRRDHEHGRDPSTPMASELNRLAAPGAERAYAEVDLPMPAGFRPGPRANGFPFYAAEFMPAGDLAAMTEGCTRLIAEHGSALGVWHGYCLPRTKEACAFLAAAGETVPIERLADEEAYGQQMTMVPAYVCGYDYELLAAVCRSAVDDPKDAGLIAYELTQGFDNDTLRADQGLWRVGRLASGAPAVMDALASSDVAAAMAELRVSASSSAEVGAFFAALDAFLEEFGSRGESWDIACPTWNEQRDGFWRQLRQMARDDVPEPRASIAAAAERRAEVMRTIESRLSGDADTLARFRRRVARAEPYVAIREERARWQLVLAGELRHALLRRGARLVERGAIDAPHDVLYLLPGEVEGMAPASRSASADLRDAVAQRRAEHEYWKTKVPPVVIGGDASGEASEPAAEPTLPADGVVRGVGASRGVATGRARVIVDLDDADRLDAGDVLVCVMTAPPWTPLFGIASAIVVDTGDTGSHPAIAAREYGIPCVLATRIGTAAIPDGAMVRIDGASGTVEVIG